MKENIGLTGVLKVQQLNQGFWDCCETGKVIMSHCIMHFNYNLLFRLCKYTSDGICPLPFHIQQ
jgi:hypothetical protein